MILFFLSKEIPRGRKVGYIGAMLAVLALMFAMQTHRDDPAGMMVPWVFPTATLSVSLLEFGLCWNLMARLGKARAVVFTVLLPICSIGLLATLAFATPLSEMFHERFAINYHVAVTVNASAVFLIASLILWLEYREKRASKGDVPN
jgi:hypothetical protein